MQHATHFVTKIILSTDICVGSKRWDPNTDAKFDTVFKIRNQNVLECTQLIERLPGYSARSMHNRAKLAHSEIIEFGKVYLYNNLPEVNLIC